MDPKRVEDSQTFKLNLLRASFSLETGTSKIDPWGKEPCRLEQSLVTSAIALWQLKIKACPCTVERATPSLPWQDRISHSTNEKLKFKSIGRKRRHGKATTTSVTTAAKTWQRIDSGTMGGSSRRSRWTRLCAIKAVWKKYITHPWNVPRKLSKFSNLKSIIESLYVAATCARVRKWKQAKLRMLSTLIWSPRQVTKISISLAWTQISTIIYGFLVHKRHRWLWVRASSRILALAGLNKNRFRHQILAC